MIGCRPSLLMACRHCLVWALLVAIPLIAKPSALYSWQDPPSSDLATLSAEEEKEKIAADRFLDLLLKRPATGTALDRVFGYHVERGTIGQLIEQLTVQAEAATGDQAGRTWFLLGLLQLQRGEDAQAVTTLAQAQELLKDNALAAFHHGQALLLVGDTDRAAQAFEVAITRKPPRGDYLNVARELGRLYQRVGRVDDALRIWNTLEKDFPGDESVRQRIAATLVEEGDLKGALTRFESLAKSAKAESDRISFALEVANLRSQTGQQSQAIDELNTLLSKLRPGSYLYDEARRRVERIFLSRGDYVGLTEYYQNWVKKNPQDLNGILRLARTLSLQGRSQEAIEQFLQAIERAPNDPAPRLALIDAYLTDNRFADAAKQFEALLANGEKNPDYLVKYGQVLMSNLDVPEAERQSAAAAVWKRLIEARPKDPAVHSQVADLLRGARLNDQAIEEYRHAIQLAPTEPQHKEYLGEFLHQLKRTDEALVVWRSLAEGELRTRDNLARLAEVLHQFGQVDEALKTMAEACNMKPQIAQRLRFVEWLNQAEKFDESNAQLTLARDEAESVEDRARVFSLAVKTYQIAGQLPERIKDAEAATQANPADGQAWRQLAMLYEAQQDTLQAIKAIEQAVAADPTSIDTLDMAARLAQEAGKIPEAIEQRKRLVDLDRRFRTAHLQRLTTLYISAGQNEQALATGKEMLASAGGATEAFKFYADICGQLGLPEERLDTLRRCLRLNPRSQEALAWLADQLSADFKTEQAIELTWKLLDTAEEMDGRRQAVVKLTDLYLRNNRLDQLISRLEFRGREANDRRTSTDLMATAYQQAGDLGLARQMLESLLQESGRDTLLIERMVGLCEQSGEIDRAIDLQRELVRLSPNKQTQGRLAMLLIDIGAVEEAQSLWLSTIDVRAADGELGRQVDRLYSRGEQKAALSLVNKIMESNPQDWEMLTRRMILHASTDAWADSSRDAEALLALKLPDDTESIEAKRNKNRAVPYNYAGMPYPPRLMRMQNIYELYQMFDRRYGGSNAMRLPAANDFGQAKVFATYLQMVHWRNEQPEQLENRLAQLKERGMSPAATADDVWDWYTFRSLLESVNETSAHDYRDPDSWEEVWRMTEVDPDSSMILLLNMLVNRTQVNRQGGDAVKPLSDSQLVKLKELALRKRESKPSAAATPYGYGLPALPAIYMSELRLAGKTDEASLALKDSQGIEAPTESAETSLPYLASTAGDDELWKAIEVVLAGQPSTLSTPVARQNRLGPDQLLALFTNPERVQNNLSQGSQDPTYRQRVFQLLDHAIDASVSNRPRTGRLQLSNMGMERRTYTIVNGRAQMMLISFPPTGLGPEEMLLRSLRGTYDQLKEHMGPWIEQLSQERPSDAPRLQVQRLMVAACFQQWQEQNERAIKLLERATELAAKEVNQEEAQLRLLLADLWLRQDRKQEALQAIEGITVYDQGAMTIREFAAARLAVALGDQDRARRAARRLFAVRLDTPTQIELAKLLQSLNMPDLAADLVRRMRGRSGSSTQQLQTLMDYFQSQQELEQAAEVAIELLQRSAPVPGSRNSNSRTSEQIGRTNALQVLASAGKLKELITNTEKRLERSPKSQRVRSELMEMYAAAGQTDKVQAMLGETNSVASTAGAESTVALEAMVKQLAAAGKTKELCDTYLKLLRRKPQIFGNDYYEISRPFQQLKRSAELVDLILEVGVQKFEDYRVGELCGDLARNNEAPEKVRAIVLAMLNRKGPSNNGMYALNSVFSSGNQKLLEDQEIIEKVCDSLLRTSKQSGNGWGNLFQTYSTSSDGRNENMLSMAVREVSKVPARTEFMEKLIRTELAKNDKWVEGQAWLGMLLAATKRYDQAQSTLAPMAEKDFKPQLSANAAWIIGSAIDRHPPMQELASRMYTIGLSQPQNNGSEFQYTLAGRACNLAIEMGDKPKARQLILQQISDNKTEDPFNYNNEEYSAYRRISTTVSLMDMLSKCDAPADALKISRRLDRADFTKAARYGSVRLTDFDKRVEGILDKVRQQGGADLLATMINSQTSAAAAVDLGISIDEKPFSGVGVRSIWIDVVAEQQADATKAEKLQPLVEQLTLLREQRRDDLSVQVALAVLQATPDNHQSLAAVIAQPVTQASAASATTPASTPAPDSKPADGKEPTGSQPKELSVKERSELMAVAYLRWEALAHAGQASIDTEPIVSWIDQQMLTWDVKLRAAWFGALGRQLLNRQDTAAASALWKHFINSPNISSAQLIDLASAAASNQLVDIALPAAAQAPQAVAARGSPEATKPTGSLGQLLGSARAQVSMQVLTPAGRMNEPNSASVAQQLVDLDKVWLDKKLDPGAALEWISSWCLAEGKPVNPWELPRDPRTSEQLKYDSLFNHLALRAAETKRTDEVIARVQAADATVGNSPDKAPDKADVKASARLSDLSRLLIAHLYLRDNRGALAAEQLSAIDHSKLLSLPALQSVQTVVLAMDNAECREAGVKLAVALGQQHKPTERYSEVEPYSAVALKAGQVAIEHDLDQALRTSALNLYLEMAQHDNQRYSGSYGVQRLIAQNEEVAKPLLMKGKTADALNYLAQRQPAYNLGFDRSNDWVGCWALETVQSMSDRAAAYKILADWTFAGDGALRTIVALARRSPLPAFVPSSVGGEYPKFAPRGDEHLPLVSNIYSLARLAEETGSSADLLQRLELAVQQDRAGATAAQAIVLSALKQPLPTETLEAIAKRLGDLKVTEGNEVQTPAPMLELQLATLLDSGDTAQAAWSQQTVERLLTMTHKTGRGYLAPWLARYQYQRGWLPTTSWSTANQLQNWQAGTVARAKDYYEGDTAPLWITDGQDQLEHLCGYSTDALWLRYPLAGEFAFEFETPADVTRSCTVHVAGLSFALGKMENGFYVDTTSEDSRDYVRKEAPGVKAEDWNHHQLKLDAQSLSYSINGQEQYREPRPSMPITLAIRSPGIRQSAVRNLKLTGNPVVARQWNLIGDSDMRGWTGYYYGMRLPTSRLVQPEKSQDERFGSARQAPASDALDQLSWTIKAGELISAQSDVSGPGKQALLQRTLPINAGDAVEYEFYYQPGSFEVHPALGRTALVLRPEGVHWHWMTEPDTSWRTPNDYEVKAASAVPLNLKADAWNQLRLETSADRVKLTLNGLLILDEPWSYEVPNNQFGLFHYRDKSSVRVRQMTLTGPWPEKLAEPLLR